MNPHALEDVIVEKIDLTFMLTALLQWLDDRSAWFLIMRMQGKTFKQIAQTFDLSRERVRQLMLDAEKLGDRIAKGHYTPDFTPIEYAPLPELESAAPDWVWELPFEMLEDFMDDQLIHSSGVTGITWNKRDERWYVVRDQKLIGPFKYDQLELAKQALEEYQAAPDRWNEIRAKYSLLAGKKVRKSPGSPQDNKVDPAPIHVLKAMGLSVPKTTTLPAVVKPVESPAAPALSSVPRDVQLLELAQNASRRDETQRSIANEAVKVAETAEAEAREYWNDFFDHVSKENPLALDALNERERK